MDISKRQVHASPVPTASEEVLCRSGTSSVPEASRMYKDTSEAQGEDSSIEASVWLRLPGWVPDSKARRALHTQQSKKMSSSKVAYKAQHEL